MAKKKKKEKLNLRPPIVVVLGHVDHGKTTLLDKLRKTSVVKGEAGGITQSIGASMINAPDGKRITFIDTPGHAAFANMRSRGAKLADIAILVVAANDGVMPQTKEALEYIKDVGIPFIVAATKIDLDTANPEKVRGQLEKEGVVFEDSGGDVPLIEVSGTTGKGTDDLLEVIGLLSEINEIEGDPDADFEAVVIETGKDKRGPFASLVVRNGELKVRDEIVTEEVEAKIRNIFDYTGNSTDKIGPGEPGQVIGLNDVPEVGSKVWNKGKEKTQKKKQEKTGVQDTPEEDQVTAVVKAGSAGSLEALITNLPDEVFVVESGVGDVKENDVFLAKSAKSPYIFGFEVKIPSGVQKLAETEGVTIYTSDIIYELIDDIKKEIKSKETKILGAAEVLDTFPFNKKQVAGCKVLQGEIAKNAKLIIMSDDRELGEARVTSLRRGKDDIDKAKAGEECGILMTPQLDFEKGDMILSVAK